MKRLAALLVPRFRRDELLMAFGAALAGALVAGIFGAVHDQVTYWISPEYFTRMKFDQFRMEDGRFSGPARAAGVGFLGTWWIGMAAAWFMARQHFRSGGADTLWPHLFQSMVLMMGVALGSGSAGYLIGPVLLADRPGWMEALRSLQVEDTGSFLRVAGIHLGSYMGAILGFLLAMLGRFRMKNRSNPRVLPD